MAMAVRLVWGKIGTYPWWPGKVVNEEVDTSRCWIEFFDEEKSVENMSASRVQDYMGNREKLLTAGLKHCRTSSYKSNFEKAVSIADKIAAREGQSNSKSTNDSLAATQQEIDQLSAISDLDKQDINASLSLKQTDTKSVSLHSSRPRRRTRSVEKPAKINKPATARKNKHECVSGDEVPTGGKKGRVTANRNAAERTPMAAKTPRNVKKMSTSTKKNKSATTNSKCAENAVKGSPCVNTPSGRPRKQLILPTMPSQSSNVINTNSDHVSCVCTPKEFQQQPVKYRENLTSTPCNAVQATSVPAKTAVSPREPTLLQRDSRTNGGTPPGDTPPGDTPPGDTPPGDTPPGDTPPGDTPPGDTPPGDGLSVKMDISPESVANSGSDDEDLPSFVLEAPYFTVTLGSIVWVKMRRYPHWPSLVSKVNDKQKKAAVKFINSENVKEGLWVKMTHISEYPGRNFAAYEAVGKSHQIYGLPLTKAIEQVDSYLNEKCNNDSLDPFSYFFPSHDDDESVDHLHSSDLDTNSDYTIRCINSESELEWIEKHSTLAPQYSEETLLKIQERESWLEKLVNTLREDQLIQKNITTHIKDGGRQLSPLGSRQDFLGPLVCSTKHLGADFLNEIVSLYETENKTIHLPDWCYKSLIPKAIVECIAKVDNISLAAAKRKFLSDLRTEEEDDHYHRRIIAQTERLTEEEDLHYSMLANDS